MILPELEEMQKRKYERRNQFKEVQEQIQSISNEISGPRENVPFIVDETDLSLRKLEELHRQLHTLQKEKVNASPLSLSLPFSLCACVLSFYEPKISYLLLFITE